MSRNVMINEDILSDIADSIREKTKEQDLIKPSQMASKVSGISSGTKIIPKTHTIRFTKSTTASSLSYSGPIVDLNIIDWENWSNFNSIRMMFSGMDNTITEIKGNFDFLKATDAYACCANCTNLVSINTNSWNTSNVTDYSYAFQDCTSLPAVPMLDMSSCINVKGIFENCSSMTTFAGAKDLGSAYSTSQSANYTNYKLDLSYSSLLTHDSLMNVINNLYDIALKGVQTQQLVIGSTNLAKLSSAEIAIATNKGWTVS